MTCWRTPCREIGKFVYHHKFSEELFEYEYYHVFLGEYTGQVTLNPKEAMAMQWVELDALAKDLQQNPQKYSAWFLTAAPMVLAELKKG